MICEKCECECTFDNSQAEIDWLEKNGDRCYYCLVNNG